jgi:hypothetical protein
VIDGPRGGHRLRLGESTDGGLVDVSRGKRGETRDFGGTGVFADAVQMFVVGVWRGVYRCW